ncbi:hypothetical protein EDD85DRAFT_992329 [Armillaria nabsnona]|nr:hypothetical protein EDD85DRAFT_992329 [Armillaria nabsnona]
MSAPVTGQDAPYCDSCNHRYPHKDKPGLCGHCFVLEDTQKKEGKDSVNFQELLNRDHCQGCGSISKYFQAIPEKGLHCISCFTKGNMLASRSGGNGYSPSTILSTTNLTGLRNVVNGKTELFVVYLMVNNGKKASVSRLGPISDSHHPDCLVPDFLENSWLPKYNAIWMSSLPEPLLQTEVKLCWKGNKIIEGNTHLGTLHELYAYHKYCTHFSNSLQYEDHVQTKVPHELGGTKSRQESCKNAPEMQSAMIPQYCSSGN